MKAEDIRRNITRYENQLFYHRQEKAKIEAKHKKGSAIYMQLWEDAMKTERAILYKIDSSKKKLAKLLAF